MRGRCFLCLQMPHPQDRCLTPRDVSLSGLRGGSCASRYETVKPLKGIGLKTGSGLCHRQPVCVSVHSPQTESYTSTAPLKRIEAFLLLARVTLNKTHHCCYFSVICEDILILLPSLHFYTITAYCFVSGRVSPLTIFTFEKEKR